MSSLGVIPTDTIDQCNNCLGRTQIEIASGRDFEYATCANVFHFVECGQCGLVYLRNRPAISTLDIIYPREYIPHFFDKYLGGFIAGLRRRIQKAKVRPLSRLLPDNGYVIDVGPGNGEFLSLLREHGAAQWRLCGVDFSEAAIESIRSIGIQGIVSRFETLSWNAQPPMAIVMNQVIEHLADPQRAVRKAFELLAPGGILFIETPSIDGWDYKIFRRRYWGGWHTPRHWVLYNQETLGTLLRTIGFEIVETSYLLSPNFWLQSIHHFLVDRHPRLARLFDVKIFPSLLVASAVDLIQKGVRNRTSNVRMIGRKPFSSADL